MKSFRLLKTQKIFFKTFTTSTTSTLNNFKDILRNNHPQNNIPTSIEEKVGYNLHQRTNHPLNIIKKKVEDYCNEYAKKNNQSQFIIHDNEIPITNTKNCFDDLLVPLNHISRSRSDTYYIDDKLVSIIIIINSHYYLIFEYLFIYSY